MIAVIILLALFTRWVDSARVNRTWRETRAISANSTRQAWARTQQTAAQHARVTQTARACARTRWRANVKTTWKQRAANATRVSPTTTV